MNMGDMEWEGATPENVAILLEMADRVLAERQTPIAERPLAALIQLVHWRMVAGRDGTPITLDGSEIAKSEAFRPLGKMIGDWYQEQYGKPTMSRRTSKIVGFVLVRMSPFLIEVPTNLTEPGDEPDTAWLRFTDHVLPTEDVLEWVIDGPHPKGLPDISALRQEITAVANDLRFIYTASLGVLTENNEQLSAFVRGIGSHLNQAARRVADQKAQDVAESYWEMQMAAEVALKALILQRTSAFSYTHSLATLVEEVQVIDSSFPANPLANFPDDRETIKRRYGTGKVSWEGTFAHYRVVLGLVRNTVERMKRTKFGGASICIRKAPWAVG